MNHNIILNNQQIEHKLKRIAYQIYETFLNEEEVILAGIAKNGYVMAQKLETELKLISTLNISICEIKIDKENLLAPIKSSLSLDYCKNKGVVIVDDVLNSGGTLMYAVKYFLEIPISKFKTAVLVDRNHKKYPIKADFKGLSLSTSLQERVEVILGDKNEAYLI